MDFQTETFRQYFTESWKIFTGNATITNILTDGNISSVFYRELQNIYCKCHNHRRLYMSRGGARRRLATVEALCRASWCEVSSVGKGFWI
jgi:hypothetical protein